MDDKVHVYFVSVYCVGTKCFMHSMLVAFA